MYNVPMARRKPEPVPRPVRSLRPLYRLMAERDLRWQDIRDNVRMQPEILSGIRSGRVPRMYVIQRLMDWLGCRYSDIVGWDIC